MTSHIVVVDDDESIRSIVVELLSDEGHRVAGYSNALEALEHVRVNPADLVILDMRMPVMNGWEFAKAIRDEGRDIPILVMTAAQDARAWAEEIRAVGYIAKPFEIDRLVREVARLLGSDGGRDGVLSASLAHAVRSILSGLSHLPGSARPATP